MIIQIGAEIMRGDETPHTARYLGLTDGWERWEVSWLPGRVLSRNQAVTAMTIAETVGRGLEPGGKFWRFVDGWASELGLQGLDAVALAAEPVQAEVQA